MASFAASDGAVVHDGDMVTLRLFKGDMTPTKSSAGVESHPRVEVAERPGTPRGEERPARRRACERGGEGLVVAAVAEQVTRCPARARAHVPQVEVEDLQSARVLEGDDRPRHREPAL